MSVKKGISCSDQDPDCLRITQTLSSWNDSAPYRLVDLTPAPVSLTVIGRWITIYDSLHLSVYLSLFFRVLSMSVCVDVWMFYASDLDIKSTYVLVMSSYLYLTCSTWDFSRQ